MYKLSPAQESLLKTKDKFVTMYGGIAYNPLFTDMAQLEQKFVVLKQRPTGKIGGLYLAARCGGKTGMVKLMWEDECSKLFSHKHVKLLQSKSKQPRIVSVVCK